MRVTNVEKVFPPLETDSFCYKIDKGRAPGNKCRW